MEIKEKCACKAEFVVSGTAVFCKESLNSFLKAHKNCSAAITIKNNKLVAVEWDAQAIRSVEIVSQGLLNLTKMFNAQNIRIDTMMQVTPPYRPEKDKKK